MFFRKKTEKILHKKTGQNAIIEIGELLAPIFYKNFKKLSLPERNIVCIFELERDVNNDGFDGYFNNIPGNYTKETLNALKIIGSKTFLKIFENAIKRFPNEIIPVDRFERQEIIIEFEKKYDDVDNYEGLWNDLDNEFYKYEEDIYSLMIDYIKNNIKDFR
jgi:hypothetical protein